MSIQLKVSFLLRPVLTWLSPHVLMIALCKSTSFTIHTLLTPAARVVHVLKSCNIDGSELKDFSLCLFYSSYILLSRGN